MNRGSPSAAANVSQRWREISAERGSASSTAWWPLIQTLGLVRFAQTFRFEFAKHPNRQQTTAARMRDTLCYLVTAAGLTTEAIRLAQEKMATLRRLAADGGAKPELLAAVGQLCAGKHPASSALARARNTYSTFVTFASDSRIKRVETGRTAQQSSAPHDYG
jgi:hypothetical protein